MRKKIAALEKRVAKLEKAAVLFEKHRQAWIRLEKGAQKMKREMDRDKRIDQAKAERQRADLQQTLRASIADPRRYDIEQVQANVRRALVPNEKTIAAIEAARRGDVDRTSKPRTGPTKPRKNRYHGSTLDSFLKEAPRSRRKALSVSKKAANPQKPRKGR